MHIRFHPASYSEVPEEHKTDHSCWECPTPRYWTSNDYIVVRADEIGTGQSPGVLNVFSPTLFNAIPSVIEWASEQPWSTGKVGLLGISYYATTQWYAASRNPKGLVAMIPWEGFSDYYRDCVRHGGILNNHFFGLWWPRQVESNQYGLPGKASRGWGPDTIEGDLPHEELKANIVDMTKEVVKSCYADDAMFASMNLNYDDIKVPFLSVANLGGTGLHLRGNVYTYMHAASELKYLRFISGRHDLPFFFPAEVEVQKSFLDAFLHGKDPEGWSRKGEIPSVSLLLRKGNPGYNDALMEAKTFARRPEREWPIARTQYTKLYLQPDHQLSYDRPSVSISKLSYPAMSICGKPGSVSFSTPPFAREIEITGHIVVHLRVAVSGVPQNPCPSDIDLFITLHHFSTNNEEVFYTGTTGQPIAITNGNLRVSHRKVCSSHRYNRTWLPHRTYLSTDVQSVIPGEIYEVDVEVIPTSVVIEQGGRLVLEIGSEDSKNTDIFKHNDPVDRYVWIIHHCIHLSNTTSITNKFDTETHESSKAPTASISAPMH